MKLVKVAKKIEHVWRWTCPQCRELLETRMSETAVRRITWLQCENCLYTVVKKGEQWGLSAPLDRSRSAPWRVEEKRIGDELMKTRKMNLKRLGLKESSVPAKQKAERRAKVLQIGAKGRK